MLNKKYQVFVSSTYEDLKDERKEVTQGVLVANCIPAGMELFPASNKKQWDVIKKVIDDCDYYLLIIAGKYGSIGTDDEGRKVSYTEMEFDYAYKTNKPIIALVHSNISLLPASKVENSQKAKKLEKFKEKAMNGRLVAKWDNKDNLKLATVTSLNSLKDDSSAIGWVRANEVVDFNSKTIGEYIVFPRDGKYKINTRLSNIIGSNLTASMKIICYGTNRYGRIIEDVITNFHDIALKVIVCSPFTKMIDLNIDRDEMFKNINDMLKANNITVMISSIPPTIRAAMVYNEKNAPIWCSIQPYYIFRDDKRMFRGEAYAPAITSDEEYSCILKDMAYYFNCEFERLERESQIIDTNTMEEYYEKYIKN